MKTQTAIEQLKELKAQAAAMPEQIKAAIDAKDLKQFRALASSQSQLHGELGALTIQANNEKIEAIQKQVEDLKAQRTVEGEKNTALAKEFVAAQQAMNESGHKLQQISGSILCASASIGEIRVQSRRLHEAIQKEIEDKFSL
jgi:uncharacterized coiled-coil DUF342 family protein